MENGKFTIIGENFNRMQNLTVSLLNKYGKLQACNIIYKQNAL